MMAIAYGGKHQPRGLVLLGANISRSSRLGHVRACGSASRLSSTLHHDGRAPMRHPRSTSSHSVGPSRELRIQAPCSQQEEEATGTPSRTRVQAGCGLPRCGRDGIKKSAPAARSSNSQQGPKVADISLPADDPLLDSKGEDHGKPADVASRANPGLSRQQRYRQSDRCEKTGERRRLGETAEVLKELAAQGIAEFR